MARCDFGAKGKARLATGLQRHDSRSTDGLSRSGGMACLLRHAFNVSLPAVFAAVAVAAMTLSATSARTLRTPYVDCPKVHPRVATWKIAVLGVRGMSCARAATVIRAGAFSTPPGGLTFQTSGFTCSSPIGPPPPGSAARYFTCQRRSQSFRFTVSGYQ